MDRRGLSDSRAARPPARRPLGDATDRVVNASAQPIYKSAPVRQAHASELLAYSGSSASRRNPAPQLGAGKSSYKVVDSISVYPDRTGTQLNSLRLGHATDESSSIRSSQHNSLQSGHRNSLKSGHHNSLKSGHHESLKSGHHNSLKSGHNNSLKSGHNSLKSGHAAAQLSRTGSGYSDAEGNSVRSGSAAGLPSSAKSFNTAAPAATIKSDHITAPASSVRSGYTATKSFSMRSGRSEPYASSVKSAHTFATEDQEPMMYSDDQEPKRFSDVSGGSGASGVRHKKFIGPWQLGKTLGKGSAGRVRMARHHATKEPVAVKIIPKQGNPMTHSGSIAQIDKWDRSQPEFITDHRMPMSIEREVAILKLIDHPNIVKLYDIWENRSEIYLVLEFAEHGDLFEYINATGPLEEQESMYYFRQMISGLEYCHSFNICHRDLKPENILLMGDGKIKIADFGMAAIQQSPKHELQTSCGSPHYAAPELVGNRRYRGDLVDLWSVGIILYACLCSCLPFDDPSISRLLQLSALGVYEEPPCLSRGSRDLIRRLLTVNPSDRITIPQIWKHAFVRKYDDLDDLNGKQHRKELDEIRRHGKVKRVAPEDIDMQTLRQLKSMYHTFTEKDLALKLVSDEANDQKMFYSLLINYRERQLENYPGDLAHSDSDFHHLRPANWKKKFTTLEFPARFGRTPSRFTVISNVASDASGFETVTDFGSTEKSYDPYKDSRRMGSGSASRAKITIHRNASQARSSSSRPACVPRMRSQSFMSSSTTTRSRSGRRVGPPSALTSSHRSMASIRSGNGRPFQRQVSMRGKRSVHMSYASRRGPSCSRGAVSIAGDSTTYDRDLTSPMSPVKRMDSTSDSGGARSRAPAGTKSLADISKIAEESFFFWNEELSQFSEGIARDCDDAFGNSLLPSESYGGDTTSFEFSKSQLEIGTPLHDTRSTSASVTGIDPNPHGGLQVRKWKSRPLPVAPSPTSSVLGEILDYKLRAEQHRNQSGESSEHGDRIVSHAKRLGPLVPVGATGDPDRRAASAPAPIYSKYSTQWGKGKLPLASIAEDRPQSSFGELDGKRVVSAPARDIPLAQSTLGPAKQLEYLARQDKTIRVVCSPSSQGRVGKASAAEPSNLGKKAYAQSRPDLDLRQKHVYSEINEPIPEEDESVDFQDSSVLSNKKKASWFKRTSKDKDGAVDSKEDLTYEEMDSTSCTDNIAGTNRPTNGMAGKKKGFNLAFWRNSKDAPLMYLADADDEDLSPSPEPVRKFSHPARSRTPTSTMELDDRIAARNIEPHQNWLARLFRVKPPARYLCLSISRNQAREQIAELLRGWRNYGISEVEVDRKRNIVFSKVGIRNFLNMKEVTFAAEIMTVIEHGKRSPLCIARLTQERGAASSFHKVVDTLNDVFTRRSMLVTERRKVKMMIKTCNA